MRKYLIGITMMSLLAVLALLPACSSLTEHWPAYTPEASWQPIVAQSVKKYIELGETYKPSLQEYALNGDYLNVGLLEFWYNSNHIHLDDQGVPMVNYGGTFHYNPVTVSFYSLSMHGKFMRKIVPTKDPFLTGVNRLLLMQDELGAFRAPFAFKYYLSATRYEPGWVSGMAQGVALSVLARAFLLTGDTKYLSAGDKSLDFLVTPTSEGGVLDTMADLDPSLSNHIIFEEYLARPAGYTLNGFMYALLGVYDWSQMPASRAELARAYFDSGIDTLRHILPYYDIGGFTAYDMSHVIYRRKPHVGVAYQADHIFLLHALVSITGDEQLRKYEERWASYVPK